MLPETLTEEQKATYQKYHDVLTRMNSNTVENALNNHPLVKLIYLVSKIYLFIINLIVSLTLFKFTDLGLKNIKSDSITIPWYFFVGIGLISSCLVEILFKKNSYLYNLHGQTKIVNNPVMMFFVNTWSRFFISVNKIKISLFINVLLIFLLIVFVQSIDLLNSY